MSDLVTAFKALFPPKMVVHDGHAVSPEGTIPEPPWVFLRFPPPDTLDRSLTGDRHGRIVEGELLIYCEQVSIIRLMAADIDRALDGARLEVPGFQFGRIALSDPTFPAQDRDVKYNNRHPLVISIDFTFTVFPMEA